MEETILTAQNLKFRYDSDQPVYALDGVSTEVKRGEFVAVLLSLIHILVEGQDLDAIHRCADRIVDKINKRILGQ